MEGGSGSAQEKAATERTTTERTTMDRSTGVAFPVVESGSIADLFFFGELLVLASDAGDDGEPNADDDHVDRRECRDTE